MYVELWSGWSVRRGGAHRFAKNSSLLCIPPVHSGCAHDDVRTVSLFASDNFINYNQKGSAVAMRTYTRRYKFFLLMNMLTIIWLHFNPEQCISIISISEHNNVLLHRCIKHHSLQHALTGKGYRANYEFTIFTFVTFFRCFLYSGFLFYSCYQGMYTLTPAHHLFHRTLLLAYLVLS